LQKKEEKTMAGILKLTNLLSQFRDGAPINGFAEVGERIEYTFDIENTGDAALAGITLANPDFTIVTTGFDGTLAIGQKKTVTALYIVKATDLDNGRVSIAPRDLSGNPTDSSVLDIENLNVRASLSVNKTVREIKDINGNGISDVGDQVVYDIEVRNSSPRTVFNATLKDSPGTSNANIPVVLTGLTEIDGDGQTNDLAIGQTATGSFTYTLTQEDVDSGTTSNRADAEGRTKTNSVIRGSGTATADIGSNGQLAVVKTAGNVRDAADAGEFIDFNGNGTLGDAGDQVKYSYTVRNIGNVTLTDVVLLDDKGTPLDSNNENIPLSTTTLAPGESATGSYLAPWTQADIDAGSLTNTVTATAKTPNGESVEPKQDQETVGITAAPNFTVVKTAGNVRDAADAGEFIDFNGNGIFGDAGDQVKYGYTVTNTGNVTISDVKLLDDKGTPLDGNNENIVLSATTLAPGQSATGSYLAPWTQANIDGGSVTNIVTATANDPKGIALTPKQDQETVGITAAPNFTIVKTAGNVRDAADAGEFVDFNGNGIFGDAGDQVKYGYTVTNTGNVTISDVKLLDDKGTPLDGNNENIVLSKTTLAPGESATGSYLAPWTQANIDAGSVTNIVTATANDPQGVALAPKQDQETVGITAAPNFTVVKTAGNVRDAADAGEFVDFNGNGIFGDAGDQVKYGYTVTNTGNVTISDVKLLDDKGTPLDGNNENIVLSTTTLAPGESATGSYLAPWTQANIDAGAVTNIVTATANDPKGIALTPKQDQETVGITATPNFTIVKTAGDVRDAADAGEFIDFNSNGIFGDAGDQVKYGYTVTNTGNVTISDVKLLDDKGTPLDGDNQNIVLSSTTLAPGESATGSYLAPWTQANIDAGSVTNIVTATANDPKGIALTPKQDQETVAAPVICIPKKPEICIDKVTVYCGKKGDDLKIPAGSAIAWEYKITNTGDVDLSGILLTDNQIGTIDMNQIISRSLDQDNVLNVGETWVYKVAGKAIKGDYCNDATVKGSYIDCSGDRQSVQDSDWSDYTGITPKKYNSCQPKYNPCEPKQYNPCEPKRSWDRNSEWVKDYAAGPSRYNEWKQKSADCFSDRPKWGGGNNCKPQPAALCP
jgi:uncharacterized repeat protein (TIGR01451 family)